MKCKYCKKEHERRSDYCCRECFMKGKWIKGNPNYMKQWGEKNKQLLHKRSREWYKENKERHAITVNSFKKNNPLYMDEWHERHPGYKENYMKEWYMNNKGYMVDYKKGYQERERELSRMRYKNDLNYKISCIIRARIKDALKRGHKSAHTMELLGCSIEFFKQHIERLMLPEMSWKNYGKEWEIDHIKSIFTFDLTNITQQKECFNWSNQRPLWKTNDIAKKHGYNKYVGNRNREKSIKVKNE